MQQFLQKTLTDGTPLWVVISKDVVIPLLTLVGGVVVFCVWYRRKRIEHKLLHKTKAYEILLDKELKYYEELMSLLEKMEKCCVSIIGQLYKYVENEENQFFSEMDAFEKESESACLFVTSNEVYIHNEIAAGAKSLMEIPCQIHMQLYFFAAKHVDGQEHSTVCDKALEMHLIYAKKRGIITEQIKKHLEEISRIK